MLVSAWQEMDSARYGKYKFSINLVMRKRVWTGLTDWQQRAKNITDYQQNEEKITDYRQEKF